MLFAVVFSCPLGSAFAQAQDLQEILKGTYHFNTVESCVEATGGFSGEPLYEAFGDTNTYINYISGTYTFNGVGGAVVTLTAMTMLPVPNPFPVSTASANCDFAYVVEPDRSFTLDGNCAVLLTGGPSNGLNIMITGIHQNGIVGSAKKTLLVSSNEPNVEEIFVGSDPEPVTQRMCADAGTLIRAKN